MRKLEDLRLQDTRLKSFKTNWTAEQASNLSCLGLRNNEIENLDDDAFHGFNALRALLLAFNKLSHLNLEIFKTLTSLKKLALDGNGIKHLNTAWFRR
jgi:Leucine-rich repeat (LRR) protein